ncbi:ECF RNA polymerase sigma factor SigW [Sutcliffiella rhizosphaerae]|uniref:ECF RNA polymerase sigma factor SigW n=2 Tax=Sutcliffiella rhizosphaerae TaxID=2880967 RepID=A0ABN8AD75_9BACI|nr:ECF RNA polymerase sigma factor SigW [Sutcliffiella rhizosphaerae]
MAAKGSANLQEQDDVFFIEQVLAGNKQAYAFIIKRYKNKLYAIILRMVKNPEDAKDLVQECFTKGYQELHKYDRSGKFSSWFYRVSINYCMDTFRKKRWELVEYTEENGVGVGALSAEVVYLQKEKYEQLELLLEQLPTEDRLVLLLKYIRDISYEEISEILNIPVHSVANKIHRAKKKMRAAMQREKGGYFNEMY